MRWRETCRLPRLTKSALSSGQNQPDDLVSSRAGAGGLDVVGADGRFGKEWVSACWRRRNDRDPARSTPGLGVPKAGVFGLRVRGPASLLHGC